MDARVGLLFLVVLGATFVGDARQLSATEFFPRSVLISHISGKIQASEKFAQNDNFCTLCEEYATEALDYLSKNETKTEVLEILYTTCSRLPPFKVECIHLVDYYVTLFYTELSSIQPEQLCKTLNLCENMVLISSQFHEDSCSMCHRAVSELETKLQDPDTQLEIIELLLKACDSIQNFAKKCKRMVFEYGPMILANAEQFLETNDICTMLRACNGSNKASLADS
ncbi:hypothetical protein SLE2022_314570 [Rubroshorea leprosula]